MALELEGDPHAQRQWLIIAVLAVVGAAVLASAVSGVIHKQENTDYGWPVDYRTSLPSDQQTESGLCVYGPLGINPCRFVGSVIIWTLILSPAIPLIAIGGWLAEPYIAARRNRPQEPPPEFSAPP